MPWGTSEKPGAIQVETDQVLNGSTALPISGVIVITLVMFVAAKIRRQEKGEPGMPSGPLALFAAGFIAAAAVSLTPAEKLPDFMSDEVLVAPVERTVPVIESHYGVTVLETPRTNSADLIIGEYLVLLPDRQSAECELRAIGEATADGQEAALLCGGTEPAKANS